MNQNTNKIHTDSRIYKKYLEIKEKRGRVGDLLAEFNISRGSLYDIIRRVQNGNTGALRRCLNINKFECVWKHKYKARFLALPKDRTITTVKELQKIILGMKTDEFPIYIIAEKLGKERSTILHHLSKRK